MKKSLIFLMIVVVCITMLGTAADCADLSEDGQEFNVDTVFSPGTLKANQIITARVTVTNISGNPYDGVRDVLLIVALYDKSNTMVNISYISKGIGYHSLENLSAGFKLPANISGYSAKAFVWDGTDIRTSMMIPLSNVVSIGDGISSTPIPTATVTPTPTQTNTPTPTTTIDTTPAPRNLRVNTLIDYNDKPHIMLQWDVTDKEGVSGYRIKRQRIDANGIILDEKTLSSSQCSYDDTGVVENEKYKYGVSAVKEGLIYKGASINAVLAKKNIKILALIYDPGYIKDGQPTTYYEEKYKNQGWCRPDKALDMVQKDFNQRIFARSNMHMEIQKVVIKSQLPPFEVNGQKKTISVSDFIDIVNRSNGQAELDTNLDNSIGAGRIVDFGTIVKQSGILPENISILEALNAGMYDMITFTAPNGLDCIGESSLLYPSADRYFFPNAGISYMIPELKKSIGIIHYYPNTGESCVYVGQGFYEELIHFTEHVFGSGARAANWPKRTLGVDLYKILPAYAVRTNYDTYKVNLNDYDRFTGAANYAWAIAGPGAANLGTAHHAPNAVHEYDYGALYQEVESTADVWYNYPDIGSRLNDAGAYRKMENPFHWGAWLNLNNATDMQFDSDRRGKYLYQLEHMPKYNGMNDGGVGDGRMRILNNWWNYIFALDVFNEKEINYQLINYSNINQPEKPASTIESGAEYGTDGDAASSWGCFYANDKGFSFIPENETVQKTNGNNSVAFRMNFGTDPAMLYFPSDKNAKWDLSGVKTVNFSAKLEGMNSSGLLGLNPIVSLCTTNGDRIVFYPGKEQTSMIGIIDFTHFCIPLTGDNRQWVRKDFGKPNLNEINFIEITIRKNTSENKDPKEIRFVMDGLTFDCSTEVPEAPSNPTATLVNSRKVVLTWSGNGEQYNIYRNGLFLGSAAAAQKTYEDNTVSVVEGKVYSYYIKAVGATGYESEASSAANVKVGKEYAINDSFNDNMTSHWSVVQGSWTGVDGKMKTVYSENTSVSSKILANDVTAVDFEGEYDIGDMNSYNDLGGAGLMFGVNNINTGADNPFNFEGYGVCMRKYKNDPSDTGYMNKLTLVKYYGNDIINLADSIMLPDVSNFHVKVVVMNKNMIVYVNDMQNPLITAYDEKYYGGRIGFFSYLTGADFDNVKIFKTGSVQYKDNFDDNSINSGLWEKANGENNWSEKNQQLYVAEDMNQILSSKLILKDAVLSDYKITCTIRPDVGRDMYTGTGIIMSAESIDSTMGSADNSKSYALMINKYRTDPGSTRYINKVELLKYDKDAYNKCINIASTELSDTVYGDDAFNVKIIRLGSKFTIYVDDMETPLLTAEDGTYKQGRVGFIAYREGGCFDHFDIQAISSPTSNYDISDNFSLYENRFDSAQDIFSLDYSGRWYLDNGKFQTGSNSVQDVQSAVSISSCSNFKYDIDMTVGEGEEGSQTGMLFRAKDVQISPDSLAFNGYAIALVKDTNKVRLLKYTGADSIVLKEVSMNSLIRKCSQYHISVACEGSNIDVQIDGNPVFSFDDDRDAYYSDGRVGIFAQGSGISVDNMLVSPVEGLNCNVREFIPKEGVNGGIRLLPDNPESAWSININGKYVFNNSVPSSKALILAPVAGEREPLRYTDFVYEGDVKVISGAAGSQAGLIFRVHPGDYRLQYRVMLKPGYGVSLEKVSPEGVIRHYDALNDQTRDMQEKIAGVLISTIYPLNGNRIESQKTYHVKIVAMGLNIKVYVNDMNVPVIEYNDLYVDGYNAYGDPDPSKQYMDNYNQFGSKDTALTSDDFGKNYTCGFMGLAAENTPAEFDNVYFASVGWAGDNGKGAVENGKLNIDSPTGSTKVFMCNTLLKDFTYSTKVSFRDPGPDSKAGITFRATGISTYENRFNGYSVVVDPNGLVSLEKHYGVYSSDARQMIYSASIKAADEYDITVVASGSMIQVFVNSEPAFTIKDTSYQGGSVGLIAENTLAQFDEANIYELGSPIKMSATGYLISN